MTNRQLTARWRHFGPSENQKSSDCLTKGMSPEDVSSRFRRHSGPTRHGVYFARPSRNLEQKPTRQPLFGVTLLSSNSRY